MFLKRIGLAGLFIGLGISVAGCTDGYGYGGGGIGFASDPYYDGFGGAGFAGPSFAGPGFGGPGFGGPGFGPGFGGGLGLGSYYGWQDNFYYPGSGFFVYDRFRRPYRWNDNQRRYWEGRRGSYRGRGRPGANWGGFAGNPGAGNWGRGPDGVGRGFRGDRGGYRQRGPDGQVRGYRGNRGDGATGYRGNRPDGATGYRGRSDGVGGYRGNRPSGVGQGYRGGGARSGGYRGGGGGGYRGGGGRPSR